MRPTSLSWGLCVMALLPACGDDGSAPAHQEAGPDSGSAEDQSRDGGAPSPAADASVEDPTIPDDLLPNGAVCRRNTECKSGECGTSVGGDQFCYGSGGNGDACEITQDCATGVCRGGTCTDPNACTADAECAINAVCNASQKCEQVCGANALADKESCVCLPGFEWASADPNDTNCVRPAILGGCHIFAQDNEETYLGAVGGCYDANSVCNEYGTYGSPYASDSIFNEYGSFGSKYAMYSAFNPYTLYPPILVCDGYPSGCVTTNDLACAGSPRVHPATLCSCR